MGKLAAACKACAVACLVLLFASRASAEVRLDWHAPERCPDAEDVTAAMNQWFNTMGTPAAAADLRIDAEVASTPAGYELALQLQTRSGVRRMRMASGSCDVFAQAIAVQASLLITSEQAPQPRAAKPAASPQPTQDAPPVRGFGLRAHGLLGSSPLPGPAWGAGIGGAYVALPFRVELGLGYLFPRELRYPDLPDVGGDLQAGVASLRPCAAMQRGRFELSGCVGAELALIRGKGVGVSGARATVRSWFAVVAGAGVHVFVTPLWSVWLGVDLLASLHRPVFYVAPLGPLHRPEAFGVRGSLGIEMRIR